MITYDKKRKEKKTVKEQNPPIKGIYNKIFYHMIADLSIT